MCAVFLNLWRNICNAWTYGNPPTESIVSDWQHKKIDLLDAELDGRCRSINCCTRVIDVISRLRMIVRNAFSFSERDFLRQAAGRLDAGMGRYHAYVCVPLLKRNLVLITDPNRIEAVLRHPRNGQKGGFFLGGLPSDTSRQILGENLLTFPAEVHLHLRKAIAPHFTKVQNFGSILLEICSKSIDLMGNVDGEFQVSPFLPPLVVEAVSRCFLDYNGPSELIAEAVETLLSLAHKTHKNAREIVQYQRATESLRQYAEQAIARKSPLMGSVCEGSLQTFVQLMFFAGQDTTSSLIEYLLLKLGERGSDWQQRLYLNWKQSGLSLLDFVQQSEELDRIVWEGLRLHPPSFEQTRVVQRPFYFEDSVPFLKGTEVHLLHFFSQRDRRRWGEDCEQFRPNRYKDCEVDRSLLPFSMGPTSCIGKPFSLFLVKIFLMRLISQCHWQSQTGIESLCGSVALKIEPAVRILIQRRSQ